MEPEPGSSSADEAVKKRQGIGHSGRSTALALQLARGIEKIGRGSLVPAEGVSAMPRYWIIAPVESHPSELFDKVWQFDLTNKLITIGWHELGDVSTMSQQQL